MHTLCTKYAHTLEMTKKNIIIDVNYGNPSK